MRSVHKLIVANIDADMTQISEEHQISRPDVRSIDALADARLGGHNARQLHAVQTVDVPDKPAAIETGRGRASQHVRRAKISERGAHNGRI